MSTSGKVFVVVTAAGKSQRMGGLDKLLLPLHGRPLLLATVAAFLVWPKLGGLVVTVTPGREIELGNTLMKGAGGATERLDIIAGGGERQDSVRQALEHLDARYRPSTRDVVMIHDGARPFVDVDLFEALLAALEGNDGVIPATPVRDTVKRVDGGKVLRTEDRETLRMVQTPQAFAFSPILEMHRRAQAEGFLGTDDASLVEHYGGNVVWIPGPAHNLKVTVPEDIALLEELAARSRSS